MGYDLPEQETMTRRSARVVSYVDGNEIHNEILLSLPSVERETVFPTLEAVRLKPLQLLHEVGESLKAAYFCNSGLISFLSVFSDGQSVETGMTGSEGFVGLPLIAAFRTSDRRTVSLTEGTSFRVNADSLLVILGKCPTLVQQLQRFSQYMAMQSAQLAACNSLHTVQERFARWLLMCSERVGDTLPFTQALVGQLLGTRRASVSVAAGNLQRVGLIDYGREGLRILDRAKLEKASCECYGIIRDRIRGWKAEPFVTVAVSVR